MLRRYALVLRASALWTIYVWTTRMWNIWRDDTRDTPFKVVHSVLALISVAFAIATWVIVSRVRTKPVGRDAADHHVERVLPG